MRKILYTFILILTALWLTAACVFAAPLWESDTTETVTEGVSLRKLDRFYQNTWDKVRVLYIDLKNDNLSLRVLTAAGGASARETTLSMAKNSGAVAAVNADFFNMVSGPTNMLGMVVQNGALTSTPSKDAGLANFALLENNTVVMDYFTFSGVLTSPQGYTSELYAINKKPLTSGGLTMLTPAWGKTTTGDIDGVTMTEVIVVGDVITEIRVGQGATEIPQDGYVLAVNSAINGFLVDNFQVGDRIEMDTELLPDVGAIREATGGGTILVKDGKIYPFTNNVTGYAQRTAVGINKSGNMLMLVTVDGRLAECEGMNQTELANLLIELGCDTALNLDGGGSTTMVARDRFSGELTVQNTLTGSMRAVSTAIGIFEDAPQGTAYGMVAQTSTDTIAAGSEMQVYYAVYDQYYNNIAVSPSDVKITSNLPAKIDGNTIVPLEGGAYEITVTYGKLKQTVSFVSVSDFAYLTVYPQSAQIQNGKSYSFTLLGADANGNRVTLPASAVQWSVDNAAFSVEDGTVRARQTGSANVKVTLGDLTAYASVSTPDAESYNKPNDVNAPHPDYGAGNGYELYVSGSTRDSNTLLKRLLDIQRTELLSSAEDAAYRLGAYTGGEEGVLAVEGFSAQSINNNLLITVSNAKGGIRKTDQTQWAKLINAVRNASENSIVILMQNSVYEIEAGEKAVLDDILADAVDAGKKVYLVYEGSETGYSVDRGITHITCGALENAHTKTFSTDRERFACLKLTLTLNGVKFEFTAEEG